MNVGGWLLWGFVGTVVLTSMMSISQGAGMTRMSMPLLLGMMFTPDRDRAKLYGVGLQLANGWLFSLLYVAAFESWGAAGWWRGTLIGLVHGAFVLFVGLPLAPSLHRRMASEQRGPTAARHLEPPGFLGMHYGFRTPLVVMLSHLVFGAVLGASYHCR
jgi:hypothetical protein